LIPNIGELPLNEVSNKAAQMLVEKMSEHGLSPKTIVNNVAVVKLVVASAVNENGEQIYPRAWNHDFIGLPVVDPATQKRQTVTKEQLEKILTNVAERYTVLLALIAGTGLRIGEALGVRHGDFTDECRVLTIQRSVWSGKPQLPKTSNALRTIDVPEELAKVLCEYVQPSKDAYLFESKNGTPLEPRNVLDALHATGVKVGFHALRRYRTETLRRARVPEDLIHLWLGHASATVTDFYARGLREDVMWRSEWCERAGLGFALNGLRGYKNVVEIKVAKSA
jgi:integrase